MSTAVQTQTQAALQAAINYASANNKFFELEPGYYEIYGTTPLTVPQTGLFYRGTRNTQLIQFNPAIPILVLGDATGANQMYKGLNFRGISLTYKYGINITGQQNAIGLLIGPSYDNIIEDITVAEPYLGYGSASPYIAISIPFFNTYASFFNNAVRDIEARYAQQTIMLIASQGTGNIFDNIYLTNGFNANADALSGRGVLTGPALQVGSSGFNGDSDNVFTRINVEAVSAPNLVSLIEAGNCTFVNLHVEGVIVSQQYGSVISIVGGETCLLETQLLEVDCSATGTSIIDLGGGGESVLIKGLTMNWQFPGTSSLQPNTPLVQQFGNPPDEPTIFHAEGIKIIDNGGASVNLVLDNTNNDQLPGQTLVGSYKWNYYRPQTDEYRPQITSSYTHYGRHANATLFVPASLSAAITITLHNLCKASGVGASEPTPLGTTVHIRRVSGSYSNTLTIVDRASGGTLATNTSAGADYLYRFNGTNWVAMA